MKFYVVMKKGEVWAEKAHLSPSHAMRVIEMLAESGIDVSDFSVQEYEGWATCNRWREGEKILEDFR